MKKRRLLALLCAIAMLAAFMAGCDKGGPDKSSGPGEASGDAVVSGNPQETECKLAGTYLLDATPLGMPVLVYLTIGEDDTFNWTNKRENGEDKGFGTIGGEGGTYLLLYSDSTPEALKTATFTVVGGNLLFSTRVPYGTSGFAPNTEDENNIIYPIAKKLLYEEYLGEYVSDDGSVSLRLSYGAGYTYESASNAETGVFSISGGGITLAADGGGTKSGEISMDAASIGGGASLLRAVTAQEAGRYFAPDGIELTLDKLGRYSYTSGSYGETGTFTVLDGGATFTSSDGSTRSGTVEAFRAAVSFPRSAGAEPTAFTAYESVIQGVLVAEEEIIDDGETETPPGAYAAHLSLGPDGAYELELSKDGQKFMTETGTFTTTAGAIGVTLDLTSDAYDISSGIISGKTVNIRFVIDEDFNEVGFQLAKQ